MSVRVPASVGFAGSPVAAQPQHHCHPAPAEDQIGRLQWARMFLGKP